MKCSVVVVYFKIDRRIIKGYLGESDLVLLVKRTELHIFVVLGGYGDYFKHVIESAQRCLKNVCFGFFGGGLLVEDLVSSAESSGCSSRLSLKT